MHGVDFQIIGVAQPGHGIHKIVELDGNFVNIGNHNHGEVTVEDGLGNIQNIDAVFGAFGTDLGDDAH